MRSPFTLAVLVLSLAGGAQETDAPPVSHRARILLNLAAHPDDEDGATLLYYRRKFGVRTAIVVATRGEGGQNAIGPETGVDLGALRSLEMAGAARTLEADLYFLNLVDFGYSKSLEETLRIWGRDAALERLVRRIREIGPDVIVTNHDPERGHGHHRAIAALALDAFRLAADPAAYPDHARDGLAPHRTLRLFFRTGEAVEGAVRVPVGERDLHSGKSYREMALASLRSHDSQGPWDSLPWQEEGRDRYYRLVRSTGPAIVDAGEGLFSGLPARPEWAEPYWEANDPADILSREGPVRLALAAGRMAAVAETPGIDPNKGRWLRRHSDALEKALWQSLDIVADIRVRPLEVAPGGTARAKLVLQDAGDHAIAIISVRFRIGSAVREIEGRLDPNRDPLTDVHLPLTVLGNGERFGTVAEMEVPFDFAPTLPMPETLYERDRVRPPLEIEVRYRAFGQELRHRWRSDLEVRPAFSLGVARPGRIIPLEEEPVDRPIRLLLDNRTGEEIEAEIGLDPPTGFAVEAPRSVVLPAGESEQVFRFHRAGGVSRGPNRFRAWLRVGERTLRRDITVTVAEVSIDREMRCLVLEGVETTVGDLLRDLGVQGMETEAPATVEGLRRFDSIVVGARACATRGDLHPLEEKLLEYVRGGGHLLVLYHKARDWGGKAPFAPYPLPLSRDRVTDEGAPVRLLRPDHPLLRAPNLIGARDWEGWIQERGLYFPKGYPERYEGIVSIADPGEEPLNGGILYAEFGEGSYVYTSLVWHRQVRAGHAGAARILANLIAPRAGKG